MLTQHVKCELKNNNNICNDSCVFCDDIKNFTANEIQEILVQNLCMECSLSHEKFYFLHNNIFLNLRLELSTVIPELYAKISFRTTKKKAIYLLNVKLANMQ